MDVDQLLDLVSYDPLAQLTLDLVRIPSPTRDSERVAEFSVEYLRGLGMQAELVRDFPKSPSVVARYGGAEPGPTLEFNGHLDTIPVPAVCPVELKDSRVYGRGAADMKSGLAAIAEAMRVVIGSGQRLKGDLLVVAHGLHEAPGGLGEDISSLVKKGVKGDAVIVAEAGGGDLPILSRLPFPSLKPKDFA